VTRVRINYPANKFLHGQFVEVVATKPGYRASANQYEVKLLVGRGVYRPGDTVFLSSEHVVEVE
jgi:hypothetical protein